jgi:hypothetical protein
MGKIEEVDIGPAAQRTDEKWRRLENGEFEQVATGKVRLGRDGKPRRPPKRRNSEDVRRDQLVEAVLSESKRRAHNLLNPALADVNSGLLRCDGEFSRTWRHEQRRSHTSAVPSRLLRVDRRSATTTAQAPTNYRRQRRERSTQRTETRWFEERTCKNATS